MGTLAASNFNSFEIAQTGATTISPSSSTTTWTTVAHNLGYTPIPLAILDGVGLSPIYTNGVQPLPTHLNATIGGGSVTWNSFLFCSADITNVYFITLNATGGSLPTFPIKYYLLRERAT